ncbi:MAG: hypothetical protein NWT08_07810 [Akkermansiaceae bacterium]|nr:hypothetical protein [Akkermansiaceae bacterium]MDP4646848.1 hypothetical protein [Akkermansiaceae bacterium]MDP4719815.1 hypothetical protein [Akkermansiaceae bacterium]MDP4780986.1 hypothetical protein [Akkermansiaceae bacterium]MDP4846828.1 hypothetical protein [Akkermansiaceae bacterium]
MKINSLSRHLKPSPSPAALFVEKARSFFKKLTTISLHFYKGRKGGRWEDKELTQESTKSGKAAL